MLASVTIDLDALRLYGQIHGLDAASDDDAIHLRALPRFLDLCAAHGIRATLFTVASDLERPAIRDAIAAASRAGHEIANHSDSHDYRLRNLPNSEIAQDLRRAHERIASVTGIAPVGFRAPGYNLAPAMIDAIVAMGYTYDSSLLPSPVYYGAKATALALIRLRGGASQSLLDHPFALFAPTKPYRIAATDRWDRLYRRGKTGILEIPMAVVPGVRAALIGTSITLAAHWLGVFALELLVKSAMASTPLFNLELHGIDFADAREDAIDPLIVKHQPDLALPIGEKLGVFDRVFRILCERADVLPMREAVARL